MDSQEAIKILGQYDVSNIHFYTTDGEEIPFTEWSDALELAISALQEQESSETQKALDTISRQAAIDALCDNCDNVQAVCPHYPCKQYTAIDVPPSAQPTLYGYNVEHLILIAIMLQKENLPPERVTEALTNIGRTVSMVRDEFEETLRKSVEQLLPVGNSF